MQITETVNRECCQHKDLKPLNNDKGMVPKYKFCVHCGRHHIYDRRYNGYDYDTGYWPVDFPK